MNKKIWLVIGIGLLSLSIIDLQSRRRNFNQDKKQVAAEQGADPDMQRDDDMVEPSLLEPDTVADDTFDIAAKRKQVIRLVEDGIEYLKKNPLYQAFHTFTHDKKFIRGELYLFVYDLKGNCLAHGQEENILWQNNYNLRDQYGTPIFHDMLSAVKQGGGWLTYQWRHSTKITYVKSVTKDDKDFILGAGFYPHSKESAVVNLVKGAVSVFNKAKEEGSPVSAAFSAFSYPLGRFVLGDLYLYSLVFDGTTMAQGERPGLIGTNGLDYRDARGKFVNKEIIEKLQKTSEGIWVDYLSKRATKKAYAEKVTNGEGKQYFIACGYYPDANQKQAVDLVRKGYTFMKRNGLSQAVAEFSNLAKDDFRYGDLYLVVYDFKGICKAHGAERDLIGRNQYDDQDEAGRYYVREIIEKAKVSGGWVSYKQNNLFNLTYVEPIDLGVDKFIITCGLYPISKMETMVLLAKSAASYLRTVSVAEALSEFIKRGGRFIHGDLTVFVFDSTGICLAFGDDYDLIWRNLINEKDDQGKPYIKLLINTGMRGSGKVTFTLHGNQAVAYVEKVEKEGRTLIVGSHYYK